jgi:hypothetical protein
LEECWLCPVFAYYTLAFALQLRKKHGKTSVRVAEVIQSKDDDDDDDGTSAKYGSLWISAITALELYWEK